MKYRTLEISERLKEFNDNLKEYDCGDFNCSDCPFYFNYINCVDFTEDELKLLYKIYLRLPLKEEIKNGKEIYKSINL